LLNYRRGKLFRFWTRVYNGLWGGLKHVLLPNKEGAYRILFGPGRGVRIWTNPAHGGTRFLLGRYEPPLMTWLTRAVKPGATFYDVGSNNGLVALIAAQLAGTNGTVYAFEPDLEILESLRKNVSLNPELALRIKVMPYEVGRLHDPGTRKVSVDGLVADALAKPPDVIKIDVEGAECDVLEGMTHVTSQQCPATFVECHSPELQSGVRQFFEQRSRLVEEAVPSVFEVSRHGYNAWLYLIDG